MNRLQLLAFRCLVGALLFPNPTLGAADPSKPGMMPVLTLKQARERAVASHPRISVAELRSAASRQRLLQERSAWFPQISGSVTAVGTDQTEGIHIAAGSLNAPGVYERVGVGGTVSQLITDFGRTANQVAAARLEAQSASTNVIATRQQILLEVDAAYFGVLRAASVEAVASATLTARQQLYEQVSLLASNRLRSDLDAQFARVGVDEARLMVSRAGADVKGARAVLALLVGPGPDVEYGVVLSEEPVPAPLQEESGRLVARALAARPDLVGLRLNRDSARRHAAAVGGQQLPTLTAFGAAGLSPVHDDHFGHDYAAAGLNLSVPLFGGGIYRAREKEALRLAESVAAGVSEAELRVVREVKLAWLELQQAHETLGLSKTLAESAQNAMDLARLRFDQGLSSIVEFNQAELNRTRAEIGVAVAIHDLRIRNDGLEYAVGTLQ